MKVQAKDDIYDSDGVLLYKQEEMILGEISGSEDGAFVDHQYNLPFSPSEYFVIESDDDNQISINCESDPNDYLNVEVDFEDDGDPFFILSVYSGTQMLGGVTLYEKAKVQELIRFLQDAIN